MKNKQPRPQQFKDLLANAEHSFSAVASACTVSEMTVRNWHKGKQRPNIEQLPGLSKLLGKDYNTLVPMILA